MLQYGCKLLCVSDLLLLGRVTIEEARSLLYWLESEEGFGKTGVCGLSMGMAWSVVSLMSLGKSTHSLTKFLLKKSEFVSEMILIESIGSPEVLKWQK